MVAAGGKRPIIIALCCPSGSPHMNTHAPKGINYRHRGLVRPLLPVNPRHQRTKRAVPKLDAPMSHVLNVSKLNGTSAGHVRASLWVRRRLVLSLRSVCRQPARAMWSVVRQLCPVVQPAAMRRTFIRSAVTLVLDQLLYIALQSTAFFTLIHDISLFQQSPR